MRGVPPMPLDLRPLALAELLDRSFSVYKRHFWLFAGIMAVPASFAMVVAVLTGIVRTPISANTPPEKLFFLILPAALGLIAFSVVYLVVYMYALGATSIAVSELYLGRDTTVAAAYRRVRPLGGRLLLLIIWTFLSIFGACLLVGAVAVGFGLFLALLSRVLAVLVAPFAFLGLIVVVVLMSVRFGVSVPALAIENLPAATALKRSIELTSGNIGRVFLIILCATVIAFATSLIFTGPFSLAALAVGPNTKGAILLNIAGAISGAIGGMLSGPIMIIGLAMMYYDLRIRKEALDLELLLANLDAPRVG
jgi:hypothetical protein